MTTLSAAKSTRQNALSVRTISAAAMLAAVAYLLAFINSKLDIVLYNALPFNILKGLVIGAVTMLICKSLTPVPKGRR